ncbi:MAG: UvrD-helicase domain-containing protein [Treponema sp.]|jgi:DNA helicase-2/ATP-dependent DNA helicase PcrA|nr:UvrD-helicase domain-containing protein [Treponema sp.]
MRAVTSIKGPVLIIAGAGSGKTRVITYRIAYMLEKRIPQHAILALTFTNKAAKEMETRVKDLTGKKLQSLTVSTFHAFGLSILRDNAELLGLRKNFSIYDETDRTTLIKESLKECKMASKKVDLYGLGQLFSNVKTGLAAWNENEVTMQPVYEEYQQGLKIYNAVDFDDLLVLPLALFEKNSDILQKYRQRYQYIMVDEFQDTSLIQYKLMRLLAMQDDGEKANICVVGDDDQSIYSWRGANYRNLLLFEQDFPGITEIKLEQNYRSTSTILEAANGLIAHNTNRKEKTLWSGNSGGRPIELVYPENESSEADFIASQIRNLSISETLRYHDFGVLTRTNSLAGNIEEAFLAENIPYKVSGGTSFFQRKEIKDIISYLKVIANPHDDVSLLRIINTPSRGIGKTTVGVLNDTARRNKSGIWDAISRLNHSRQEGQQHLFQDKKALTELEEFMQIIETWQGEILERKGGPGQPWSLSQKVRALVDSIDYWGYLVLEHGKEEKKVRWKFGNIEHFIRMIENWERDPDTLDAGLYPWLNRISLITRDDGETDALGKVNLMTIHSAKGLEFPVVFIAGAEEGLMPHEKSIIDENENEIAGSIEEERRLFYVAITRAREKLYISACQKRRHLQSESECAPSPSIEEIPAHRVQHHQPASPEDEEAMAEQLLEKLKASIRTMHIQCR